MGNVRQCVANMPCHQLNLVDGACMPQSHTFLVRSEHCASCSVVQLQVLQVPPQLQPSIWLGHSNLCKTTVEFTGVIEL